jgi:8-oxo-dGTP pyrophosphatase MutT (NUDIX family)
MEPKPMAAGVIIEKGMMLLVENIKHDRSIYEPPGGKVHDGESFEACVAREAMEEVGVTVDVKEELTRSVIETPEGPFDCRLFLATIVDGTPINREPHKIGSVGWFSYDEMLRLHDVHLLADDVIDALDAIKDILMEKR